MARSRRPHLRRAARVGIAALGMTLIGISSLGAQTVGGSVYGGSGGTNNCSAAMWVQTSSVAATDGVITSWTLGSFFDSAKLKVVRPSSGNSFDVIAEAGPASPGTYPVRIAVRQGDQVGVRTASTQQSCPSAGSGTTSGYIAADPAPGGPRTSYTSTSNLEIPLTASIEPDADRDGYGDETQDQCPTNGATTGPCPLPTVLGTTFTPDSSSSCTGTSLPTATVGRVVRAPSAGVITSWSHLAGNDPTGTMRFKAFHPLGNDVYLTVGEDAPHSLTLGNLNTFAVRIPVAAGDLIGLSATGLPCLSNTTNPAVKTAQVAQDPAVGTAVTAPGGSARNLDLSAVLEPDADGDGYGDVSQDGCPSQAGTAGACRDLAAPDTSFKKAPKKTIATSAAKAKVAVTLASTEPGVTYQCKLDKGSYVPCPASQKLKVKKGKHTLSARAVDAAGNVDPTPAVAHFKVKPKPASTP